MADQIFPIIEIAQLRRGTHETDIIAKARVISEDLRKVNLFIPMVILVGLSKSCFVENGFYCLEQNYEIKSQRPIVNIGQVKLHPFFEFNTISVRLNLPEA